MVTHIYIHVSNIVTILFVLQHEDGGWGVHVEAPSSMFGTVFSYLCMRLLGLGPNDGENNACARARKWIRDHGGVTYIPSWGKNWLSVRLIIYELIVTYTPRNI